MTGLTDEVRHQVERFVGRFCPAWLASSRDDLVQMALVKLLRGASPPPFSVGLCRAVAYSVVIDEIRRQRRRGEVEMSPSLPDRIVNSLQLFPDTVAAGQQIGAGIVDALAALPPDRRRAVTLYLLDQSVPEIAELLGWDRKRTSNLVYRGLDDLRAALAERGLAP